MAINIQNIMLTSSGSNICSELVEVSAQLSRGTGALVNVVQFGVESIDLSSSIPANKLNTIRVEENASVKGINKILSDNPPDLLLVPLKSDNSDSGIYTSSEAIKVIEHYERMVLTIPCNGKKFDMSNIIIPLDTSFETRQKTPYALAMAKAFNSVLHVLGVSNDSGKDAEVAVRNYSRQVSNHIEEKGFRSTLDIRLGGNPTERILEYAIEKNAGLIIIMTEQETGFTNFFKGKYSEQMIKNSPIPVLSIHPKDLVVSEARL
jgi:nucleotide-binding universal stress UspA family protein